MLDGTLPHGSLSKTIDGAKSTKLFSRRSNSRAGSTMDDLLSITAKKAQLNSKPALEPRQRSSHMRMKTIDAKSTARFTPNTARSSAQLHRTMSSENIGHTIQGYYCQKIGFTKNEPQYSVPKDESSDFFK